MSGLRPPLIHVVTDRRQIDPEARSSAGELLAFERWLDAVVAARVDVIQVREPDLEAKVLVGVVRRLVTRARRAGVAVLVNDRADVALAAGADGVHLRADGPPVERVRSLGPPTWLIGRSAHDAAEVAAARTASYVLVGTTFPSRSKPAGAPVAGLAAIRAAAAGQPPVIAIGGITPANAGVCIAAGALGVAAIGVFLPEGVRPDALGPPRAVSALRAALSAGAGASPVSRDGC